MLSIGRDRLFSLEELITSLLRAATLALKKTELPMASIICEPAKEEGSASIHVDQALQRQGPQEGDLRIKKYRLLSISSNRICNKRDPTAHSEILALQAACRRKKNERLRGCIMLTTLEPCLMCSGAVILARIESVYYLAPTHKGPGMSWVLRHVPKKNHSLRKGAGQGLSFNHYPSLVHLKERGEPYQKLLRSFFRAKRK